MKILWKLKNLIFGVATVLAVLSVSCAKKEAKMASVTANGGEDSGGGGTRGSTQKDIEEIFSDKKQLDYDLQQLGNNIYKLVHFDPELLKKIAFRVSEINQHGKPNPPLNPDVQVDSKILIEKKEEYKKTISVETNQVISYSTLFPFAGNQSHHVTLKQYAKKHPEANFSYLRNVISQLKIKLNYAGECKDKYGHDKTAAVSPFTLDAEVCVSMTELAKIPRESLRKQIHALLMHEMMHMMGFGETDAQRLQELILKYYSQLFKENNNLNAATKESLVRKPRELYEALYLLLNANEREAFVNPKLYNSDSFISNAGLIALLSDETITLSNAYLKRIEDEIDPSDSKYKVIVTNLEQLIKIGSELQSLSEVFEEFSRIPSSDFYKYSSKEDYYFIYDRLDFLTEKVWKINDTWAHQ